MGAFKLIKGVVEDAAEEGSDDNSKRKESLNAGSQTQGTGLHCTRW